MTEVAGYSQCSQCTVPFNVILNVPKFEVCCTLASTVPTLIMQKMLDIVNFTQLPNYMY